ncbi:MAG: NAD(P)/FAD-dependent oxidoreductase [bacterium]|nr:NAD(P)/FAD-dependent oxidoreductase [bacterium]
MNYDIIVVGGGASGLVAAITAAKNRKKVLILEHKDKIAKKILATGNGKCNYTNTYYDDTVFRGDSPAFVLPVLEQFTVNDTIRFFEELGVYPKDRNGYLYPNSGQAQTILDVLRMEIERLNVEVICEEHVASIKRQKQGFVVTTNKKSYQSASVILATGGKASENLGSDGSGYELSKSFGHKITPIVPALTALRSNMKCFKMVAGVRTDVALTLLINGKKVTEESGELQLTDYGISGIPVFQISRYATRGLHDKNKVEAEIDFLPGMTYQDATSFLYERKQLRGKKSLEEFLIGLLNSKLCAMLIKEAGLDPKKKVSDVTNKELNALANKIKKFVVTIDSANSFDKAQVCAGGVNTRDINPDTMESKLVKGLFFAGELVDIDGTCGGYNLQWAWSSGYVAGMHA